MRCLELTLAIEQHIQRQCREAQSISELFNEQTCAHYPQVGRQCITHIHIDDVGQRDGTHERPQPPLQSITAGQHATHDATEKQSHKSHRAISQSIRFGRQSQSTLFMWSQQEGARHLGEHRLWESIEEQEEEHKDNLFEGYLGEERTEHLLQPVHHLSCRKVLIIPVDRTRHDEAVVQPDGNEQSSQPEEYQTPYERIPIWKRFLQ